MSNYGNIVNSINYYNARSADKLKSQQVAHIPRIEPNLMIHCTVPNYLLGDNRVLVDHNHICIKLRYLNYTSISAEKRLRLVNLVHNPDKAIDMTVMRLVNDRIIYPFALFIDGRFIPWEALTITITSSNPYLFIDLTKLNSEIYDVVQHTRYVQVMTLPDFVSCTTDTTVDDLSLLYAFDDNGLFDTLNYKYAISVCKNPNIYTAALYTEGSVNAVDIRSYLEDRKGSDLSNISDLKFVPENVIVFKNGLLDTGIKENVKIAVDTDNELELKDNSYRQFDPFLYIRQSDDILEDPVAVRFNASFLSINNGQNPNSDRYDIVVCVNSDCTNTIDNIFSVDTQYVLENELAKNRGEETPEHFDVLSEPFAMSMPTTSDIDTNITNAIRTMFSYNGQAFNRSLLESSNIEIVEYTGAQVMENFDSSNVWHIPLRYTDTTEEFVLMLVNGEMYKYSRYITHSSGMCNIPISGINPEDNIELLRFKNINNTVLDIVVNADDGFVYRSKKYINSDMILFASEPNPETDPYEYPEDGEQHLPVEYSLEYDSDGKVKIVLTDEFYYGKPLKLAYKNRYIQAQYILKASDDTIFSVDLGNNFDYCSDYSRYMVFVNGRRIDSRYYRMALPVRQTTPFYDSKMYFSLPVSGGIDSRNKWFAFLRNSEDKLLENCSSGIGYIDVDLGRLHNIDLVKVHTSKNPETAPSSITVYTSTDKNGEYTLAGTLESADDEEYGWMSISTSQEIQCQYVRLVVEMSTDIAILNEIFINGYASDIPNENLALGASVDKPQSIATYNYTADLTDGQYVDNVDLTLNDEEWFGILDHNEYGLAADNAGELGYCDITVDLGSQFSVNRARMHMFAGPNTGAIDQASKVEILVSTNNISFTKAGELQLDFDQTATYWPEMILDTPVVARFVRFRIYVSDNKDMYWCFINEVEVYGDIAKTNIAPTCKYETYELIDGAKKYVDKITEGYDAELTDGYNISDAPEFVEGDRIDIVYTPSLIKDIVYEPEVDLSGTIELDKSILKYGLGTELYMVWINGRKIPESHITDIDSTRMQIITDEKSIKHLSIMKYISGIDELVSAFESEISNWDNAMSNLSKEEVFNLLGISPEALTDQETDTFDGVYDIKHVMYELIREQYVMNPLVDVTTPFVYGYEDVDQTLLGEEDVSGNTLFNAMDANVLENIENVTRPYSTTTEEEG